MNTKSIISSLLATSLLTSTFAFARDHRFDNNQPQVAEITQQTDGRHFSVQYNRNNQPQVAQAGWNDNRRVMDNRGYNRRYHRMNYGHERMVYEQNNSNGRFNHEWRRGQVIPAQFMRDQYVVNDWRSYRLSEPPRGYRWINSDGDFILASIASGLISQIIWNSIR